MGKRLKTGKSKEVKKEKNIKKPDTAAEAAEPRPKDKNVKRTKQRERKEKKRKLDKRKAQKKRAIEEAAKIAPFSEKVGRGDIPPVYESAEGIKVFVKRHDGDTKMAADMFDAIKRERPTIHIVIPKVRRVQSKSKGSVEQIAELSVEAGTVLSRLPSLKYRQCLNYTHQIIDGLTSIHKAGYVHRDLHCDNIVVKNGNVRIIDFGLARKSESRERSMCPKPHEPDEAHDLESVANILYRMLTTGDLPKDIENDRKWQETLKKIYPDSEDVIDLIEVLCKCPALTSTGKRVSECGPENSKERQFELGISEKAAKNWKYTEATMRHKAFSVLRPQWSQLK